MSIPMKKIPLFYFPTKTVMVDDYVPFLESMSLTLCDQIQTFNDSEKALIALKAYTASVNPDCLMTIEQEPLEFFDSESLEFDLDNIQAVIANTEKNNDISVLIVDYHMPVLNGLQLLKSVNGNSFKKILLTAEADDESAIKAFNNRLIDKFIRKNSHELSRELSEIIANLKLDYFISLTDSMVKALPYVHKISKDEDVIKHFQAILVEKNIREYYLIDENGVYLLINEKGESLHYTIYNEEQLKLLAIYAENDGATEKTVEEIKACEKVPYFQGGEYWDVEAINWGGYLHVPTVIVGEEKYYVIVS